MNDLVFYDLSSSPTLPIWVTLSLLYQTHPNYRAFELFHVNCLKYSSPRTQTHIISFSFKLLLQSHPLNVVSHCVCVCVCEVTSVISNFVRPHGLYVACQAPLSMGFSRQEYWSGLLCPLPGDLPNPRIEPMSLKSPALAEMVVYH